MDTKATIAVLFASPGSMSDAGGFWITPHGLKPIPPYTPKVREAFQRAVSLCLGMHDPEFLPGPTPKSRNDLKKLGEDIVAGFASTLTASSAAELNASGGVVIFQNLLTGNYIFVDSQGHVHYVVVDPRAVGILTAAQTWLAAAQVEDRALVRKMQDLVAPYIQEHADHLAVAMAHA